jgi:hypothetical protein
MKTQFIVFILCISALGIKANGNPGIPAENVKSIIVETHTWKAAAIQVQIRNAEGQVVLEETVKTGNLRKYNLRNLPDGNYVLELSDKFKSTEQEFTISRNEVKLADQKKIAFKPVITCNEENVDINLMTQGIPAYIVIADQNGETLFEEKCVRSSVNRRYDISRLPTGNYSIFVQVGDKTYSQKFRN